MLNRGLVMVVDRQQRQRYHGARPPAAASTAATASLVARAGRGFQIFVPVRASVPFQWRGVGVGVVSSSHWSADVYAVPPISLALKGRVHDHFLRG